MIGLALDEEDEQAAADQRPGDGQRVEQVGLDRAVEEDAEHRGGQEANDQQSGEALLHGIRSQSAERLADPLAEIPAHGQDGAELDDDLEYLALLVGVIKQAAHDDQVARRRNGQEFGQPFDNTENEGFEQENRVHGARPG